MTNAKEFSLEIGDVSDDGWYCIGKKAKWKPAGNVAAHDHDMG